MNGLALAAALAIAQAPGGPEVAPERAATETPATPAAAPAPTSAPTPEAMEARTEKPATAEPAVVGTTVRRRKQPSTITKATSTSTSTSTPTPTSSATRAPPPPAAPRPVPERDEAERAARSFLEALARGDATALAALAADRFSFDGEVVAGRETIRRAWRDLLLARPPAAAPAVGTLELLPAQDAAARFGKPPARLAPLVRGGVLVAVADVGGRTVVLFVAREGGRMAVLGMHD